jgi:hypothetical protein
MLPRIGSTSHNTELHAQRRCSDTQYWHEVSVHDKSPLHIIRYNTVQVDIRRPSYLFLRNDLHRDLVSEIIVTELI